MADTDDPIEIFRGWLAGARAAGEPLPTAMTLATATPVGAPSARVVNLTSFDERGFVFHTHLESPKARQIGANPRAALVFNWLKVNRQVRVSGPVERVSDEEVDSDFAPRAPEGKISTWASTQSEVVEDLSGIAAEMERLREMHPGEVPRPPWWGGFRVVPELIELMTLKEDRLHERIAFSRSDAGWERVLLAP